MIYGVMKPPRCSYCFVDFNPFKTEGTTLQFAVSAEDAADNQRWKESGRPGHPTGLHWLCGDHVEAARKLTHLRWSEARQKMEAAGIIERAPRRGP